MGQHSGDAGYSTPATLAPTLPVSENAGPPAAVIACLQALADDSVTWKGVVTRRIQSRIHRASGRSAEIAIKECFDPITHEPSAASAEREFSALQRIAACTMAQADRALAPAALVLCREHGAYAMSWVAGTSMTEALLASSVESETASRLGIGAGNWLREFHALRPLPRQPGDFEAKLPYVRKIAAAHSGNALVRRAAEVLIRNAAAAATIELPASWIHGDMKSDNLLFDGERFIGLDAQLSDENTVAYDIAPFLNHMHLLRWSRRAFPRGLRLRRKTAVAAESFLLGYSPEAQRWFLPVAWLRAYLLLQIVAPGSAARSLPSRIARWPVRYELATVLDALEFRR